jgi:hypothetical protein
MKLIIYSMLALVLSSMLFVSCKKDKIDENVYDISYKVEGSAGVAITSIKYNTNNEGGFETIDVPEEIGAATFESDTTFKLKPRNAYIIVYAIGPEASSTLKTQIFKNGVLAKEYIRTGTNLSSELGLP